MRGLEGPWKCREPPGNWIVNAFNSVLGRLKIVWIEDEKRRKGEDRESIER